MGRRPKYDNLNDCREAHRLAQQRHRQKLASAGYMQKAILIRKDLTKLFPSKISQAADIMKILFKLVDDKHIIDRLERKERGQLHHQFSIWFEKYHIMASRRSDE